MNRIAVLLLFASFLWLLVSPPVWATLGALTWMASRRRREQPQAGSSGPQQHSSVHRLGTRAVSLAIALTSGGVIAVLASPGEDPAPAAFRAFVLAVAALDVMSVFLLVVLTRALVLVRRGAQPDRVLAWTYACTLAGVAVVLMCVAALYLPHVEGGIRALLM